jgi:hypothetical protein
MRPLLVGFASALLAGPSMAAGWSSIPSPIVQTATSAARLVPGTDADTLARAIELTSRTSTPSGNALLLTEILEGPGPVAKKSIAATSTLTAAKISRAVMRGLPLVGSALAVADLLNDLRIGLDDAGRPVMDPGQSKVSTDEWCATAWGGAPIVCQPTLLGAVQEQAEIVNAIKLAQFTACPRAGAWVCTLEEFRASTGSGSSVTVERRVKTDDFIGPGSFGAWGFSQVVSGTFGSPVGCPDGQSVAFWDTTKCTTAPSAWEPVTVEEGGARIEPHIDGSNVKPIGDALGGAGVPVELEAPPVISTPPEEYGGRVRRTNPDGSTTVIDTWWPFAYLPPSGLEGPGYQWGKREETRTYPPGVEPEPAGGPGEPPPDSVVTTEPPPSGTPAGDIITCGLPWTPPCKIDEGGTPPPSDPFGDLSPSDWFSSLPIENPPVADTSWSWSFSLPSSCSVLSVGMFGATMVELDLCQYQPIIHDIMSVVWIMMTVLGCVSLVYGTMNGR